MRTSLNSNLKMRVLQRAPGFESRLWEHCSKFCFSYFERFPNSLLLTPTLSKPIFAGILIVRSLEHCSLCHPVPASSPRLVCRDHHFVQAVLMSPSQPCTYYSLVGFHPSSSHVTHSNSNCCSFIRKICRGNLLIRVELFQPLLFVGSSRNCHLFWTCYVHTA